MLEPGGILIFHDTEIDEVVTVGIDQITVAGFRPDDITL